MMPIKKFFAFLDSDYRSITQITINANEIFTKSINP